VLRVLSVPAILITLFVGAYLATQNMRSNGPTSPAGQQEIAQAQSAGAGVDFNQVVPGLQAYFDENQTYAGDSAPSRQRCHALHCRRDLVLPAVR
jgi:hypothetical protein